MKNTFIACLVTLTLFGCKAEKPVDTSPTPLSSTPAKSIATSTPTPKPSATPSESGERQSIIAVYDSCTVYAGATDFYFKTDSDDLIQFRNSNLPEDEQSVELTVDLVDTSNSTEGPPGANPEWVGRRFELTLDDTGEVVSVTPLEADGGQTGDSLPGESDDPSPDLPLLLNVPEGFTAESFGSHEGTAVLINSTEGQVHIFIPNPSISATGPDSIIGEGGLFESNQWSNQEAGRSAQPNLAWATEAFPFFGAEELEGVVYLGQLQEEELRVTVSAKTDKLEEFYGTVTPMLSTMKLRD